MSKDAIHILRHRLVFVLPAATILFLVLVLRLFDLSLREAPGWLDPAADPMIVVRGRILDTNGEVLAKSVPAFSAFGNPRHIRNLEETVAKLAPVVDMEPARLRELLSQRRGFVWLRRQLTLEKRQEIEALALPGIAFRREYRRVYPYGAIAAHVVGVTDIDGRGLSGVEHTFEEKLASGEDVTLALDMRMQTVVREELAHAVEHFSAIGGGAVVVDIRTGDIKALVSNPDFGPRDSGVTPNQKFNRTTLGVYELGSTMKVITAAVVLEEGVPASRRYSMNPLTIGRFTIRDFDQKAGSISIPGMVRISSNTAAARMAMDLPQGTFRRWLDDLWVTRRLDLGLPESGRPLVPAQWRQINIATISFGHGIATTPVHLASAIGSIVGTGERVEPSVIKGAGGLGPRLFSEATVQVMRETMRATVSNGTGRRADIGGYEVGGKTGTADKAAGRRGYDRNRRISSFVGAFPMSDPRYAIYVMVDEPKPRRDTHGFATGGWVAAPAVGRIVDRIVGLHGLMPTPESEQLDVRRVMAFDGL